MAYTSELNSPEIFRLWSAITTVASSMERKCWTRNRKGTLYPNLFVVLVASPGIGKTEAVKTVESIVTASKKINVMPRSVTQASIIDVLKRGTKSYINGSGGPVDYNASMIVNAELGTLIHAYDLEFLSILNDLYDNPEHYNQQRRHFNEGKEVLIAKPQVSMLAGTQPAFLAHLLPEEAWNMGSTSRMILIYAGAFHDDSDVFGSLDDLPQRSSAWLTQRLGQFGEKSGEFHWTDEAMELFNKWKKQKYGPVPEHSKLQHYLPRRPVDVIKLSMVSALSATGELKVRGEDFIRATDWLLAAERVMPDIFREMAGKSDNDVLMELHYFMWQIMTQRRAKKQEVNLAESELWDFLRYRVPGEKIPRVLEVAERSHIIMRDVLNPAKWIAKPKHQHGVE